MSVLKETNYKRYFSRLKIELDDKNLLSFFCLAFFNLKNTQAAMISTTARAPALEATATMRVVDVLLSFPAKPEIPLQSNRLQRRNFLTNLTAYVPRNI